MDRLPVRASCLLIVLSCAAVMGCGGGDGGTEVRVPAMITVTPSSHSFSSIGANQQFIAAVVDETGSPLNTPVSWSSSDPFVAAVGFTGLTTAVADGSATITATVSEITGRAEVTVEQMVANLVVVPSSLSLMATLTDRIAVLAEDGRGNTITDATITWASDDVAVATVDAATGDIAGVAAGTATITATSGPTSSEVALTVIPFANVTFSGSVEPIFTVTCARAGCHTSPSPPRGLDLSAGNAFNNTVGVGSTDVSTMNQIEPNDPLRSYIVHKLRGSQATVGGQGSRMPLGGVVSNDEIAGIVAWILAGALNN